MRNHPHQIMDVSDFRPGRDYFFAGAIHSGTRRLLAVVPDASLTYDYSLLRHRDRALLREVLPGVTIPSCSSRLFTIHPDGWHPAASAPYGDTLIHYWKDCGSWDAFDRLNAWLQDPLAIVPVAEWEADPHLRPCDAAKRATAVAHGTALRDEWLREIFS